MEISREREGGGRCKAVAVGGMLFRFSFFLLQFFLFFVLFLSEEEHTGDVVGEGGWGSQWSSRRNAF